MSIRIFAFASLALLPLSGCVAAAVGTAGAVGVAAAQDKTIGEAVDDSTASTEIKTKLLREGRRFSEVDVEVAEGLVLLSGRVNSPEDRVQAEGIAWTSNRVLDVANEIRIEAPGGFVANVSDEIITGRVRSRLIGSRTVKSLNFNIETYGGVVYLMGTARTQKELQRAAEEASYVTGVKQVVSYVRLLGDAPARVPAPISQRSGTYQSGSEGAYTGNADGELLGGTY